MSQYITGIQQGGIGVTDASEAKYLYKDLFGMNVLIFEDKAEASLMKQYTGSELHSRHAILSLNMSGGGGFEIWQFTSRQASMPGRSPRLGDLGIFALKIKTGNVKSAHEFFQKKQNCQVSPMLVAPDDRPHFWITDPYGNHFNIVEGDEWFKKGNSICGGVTGAVIGVSNMEKSIAFYKEMLGIDEVIYKGSAPMIDMPYGEQEGQLVTRVLLKKQVSGEGAFSKLLGSVHIELIETKERTPAKIFANRYWGDCGFIHLCFDVLEMDELKKVSSNYGYPFTVDSSDSFSMGTSAGRFCYVEDPDGTLIELVETHKVPILKKLGWYRDLKKRDADKRLPDWMIGMLGLNKIR
jgi:catechol 2,3-dioxygenase-like lactoylglutathione lyase family enzyme